MEGDISTDPFYRLIFPTMDMLEPSARATLEEACATKEPLTIKAAVEEIRKHLREGQLIIFAVVSIASLVSTTVISGS